MQKVQSFERYLYIHSTKNNICLGTYDVPGTTSQWGIAANETFKVPIIMQLIFCISMSEMKRTILPQFSKTIGITFRSR